MTSTRTHIIRELNDAFRKSFLGGKVVLTKGITQIPNITDLLEQVRRYDAFTPDNDPHGEHDFGALEFEGHTIFWKIDYHNLLYEAASPDPANPCVTYRALTVMLGEEY